MHLFHSDSFEGDLKECDEGNLEWVEKSGVYNLPLWAGDKIFLKLLEENIPFFSLKLVYEGEKLIKAVLNQENLNLGEV
jgi:8-oxo-dGTP diphosphatase